MISKTLPYVQNIHEGAAQAEIRLQDATSNHLKEPYEKIFILRDIGRLEVSG